MAFKLGMVAGCAAVNAADKLTHHLCHQNDEAVMNEMIQEFTEKTNENIRKGHDDVVQPPKHDLEG